MGKQAHVLEKQEEIVLLDAAGIDRLSALLTRGELRATLCHTHRWAEYELPQRPELRLAPLPVAAGSADLVYLPCARLAGDDAVTTGERNFFEFLVSTPFQQAMMRSLIGISPYLPELQVQLDENYERLHRM